MAGQILWLAGDINKLPGLVVRPRHGGKNRRGGDGSKAFNAAGFFRPTHFQNSICAASSSFKVC